MREIPFNLTLHQVEWLMRQSGITHEDTGSCKGKYVLGRKNEVTGEVDTGSYDIGNCRFILWEDNISESNVNKISSERQLDRIADGSHPFCDSNKQRELSIASNRKRLDDGSHNLLGVLPWDNVRTKKNPSQMKMWAIMPHIHKLWKSLCMCGHKALRRYILIKFNIDCNCNCLVMKFREIDAYNKLLEEWNKKYV